MTTESLPALHPDRRPEPYVRWLILAVHVICSGIPWVAAPPPDGPDGSSVAACWLMAVLGIGFAAAPTRLYASPDDPHRVVEYGRRHGGTLFLSVAGAVASVELGEPLFAVIASVFSVLLWARVPTTWEVPAPDDAVTL